MEKKLAFLKEITEATGISGYEANVRKIMEREFEAIGAEISHDNIGSVIGTYVGNPDGPRILIAGHMDEIGFIVTEITEGGYLKFHTVGGWWSQVMLSQQYNVTTKDGKVYRAVMGSKPPHILSPEERNRPVDVDAMYLDLGVKNKQEVLDLGIRLGDMITPAIDFQVMANPDYLLAKAFDNRIGCVIALDVMRNVYGKQIPNTLLSVGTVQEELGLRGARTTAQMVKPDVVLALDVTIATDVPGLKNTCKMGNGPTILLSDSALIGHVGLRNYLTSLADELGIPYQIDYLKRGGTDAGAMHLTNAGAPALSICIPSRYIHSHTSMISYSDYENTVKLLTALVERLDHQTLVEIKGYDK
ncbi:MAG: M42 family metallopeptidase [Bacilli bacterium]|nr:M42 family metallopeptidase [Bacilli bacterium]